MRRGAVVMVLTAALLTPPAICGAQDGDASTAGLTELREAGKAALKEGRLDDAVAFFSDGLKKANDETSTWHMLLGLALAHELSGNPVQAATYYRRFVSRSAGHAEAKSGRWASRRRSALKDIDKLEPEVLATHALVTVSSDPAGAVVELADGSEYTAPAGLYLSPGQHQLELTRQGFATMILVVSVTEGQRVTIQRSLLPLKELPPIPESPVSPANTEEPPELPKPAPGTSARSRPRSDPSAREKAPPPPQALGVLGWSFVGLGAASIGTGVVFTLMAADASTELDDLQRGGLTDDALARDAELRDDLSNFQAGAMGLYAGGGALAVGGLLMLLFRPGGPLAVTPTVGLQRIGLHGVF